MYIHCIYIVHISLVEETANSCVTLAETSHWHYAQRKLVVWSWAQECAVLNDSSWPHWSQNNVIQYGVQVALTLHWQHSLDHMVFWNHVSTFGSTVSPPSGLLQVSEEPMQFGLLHVIKKFMCYLCKVEEMWICGSTFSSKGQWLGPLNASSLHVILASKGGKYGIRSRWHLYAASSYVFSEFCQVQLVV